MTLEVGVDLVILPPLIFILQLFNSLSIDHLWLPDTPPAPAEEYLGGGAVVGQGVGGSELDQQCPGVGEVVAVLGPDKSDRLSSSSELAVDNLVKE